MPPGFRSLDAVDEFRDFGIALANSQVACRLAARGANRRAPGNKAMHVVTLIRHDERKIRCLRLRAQAGPQPFRPVELNHLRATPCRVLASLDVLEAGEPGVL